MKSLFLLTLLLALVRPYPSDSGLLDPPSLRDTTSRPYCDTMKPAEVQFCYSQLISHNPDDCKDVLKSS